MLLSASYTNYSLVLEWLTMWYIKETNNLVRHITCPVTHCSVFRDSSPLLLIPPTGYSYVKQFKISYWRTHTVISSRITITWFPKEKPSIDVEFHIENAKPVAKLFLLPFLMHKRQHNKAIRTLCSRVHYCTISFPLVFDKFNLACVNEWSLTNCLNM